MPRCLMIIYARLTDREAFGAYARAVPPLVAKFGGAYRVLGGNPEVLEGEWPFQTAAVSEWPSREAALSFWRSPEYIAAKELRAGTGDFQVVLLDGKDGD